MNTKRMSRRTLRGPPRPCQSHLHAGWLAGVASGVGCGYVESVATERDRAHFEAIATAEAQSDEERIDRAAKTPPGERMLLGIDLGLQFAWTPAHLAEADAEADGQMELARRRIALGLSRDRRE